jgi:putative methionine-R-sulfoxide reductase with GAF domain
MLSSVHLPKKNIIYTALVLLICTILVSVGFIFYNRHVILTNTKLKLQKEAVMQELRNCYDLPVRHIDVSLRGFALIHEERFLYLAPDSIEADMERSFVRLDSLLSLQDYRSDTVKANLAVFKNEMRKYSAYHKEMVALVRKDSMNAFLAAFAEDKGKALWSVYKKVADDLTAFELSLDRQSEKNYEAAMNSNIYIQLFLFLFGVPTLVFVMARLRQESANRKKLLYNLEENNRKYLFNPGDESLATDTENAIDKSIDNFKRATEFIKQISKGNYDIQWSGMTPRNLSLNHDTLAGELLKMKEQMEKVKTEDEKRNWTNEGIATFSTIIRNNQDNLEKLANEALRFLTKYLRTQQGSLFVAEEDEAGVYLHLAACYAFDRKKFVEKRIEIGNGLVGQTYLEGETVLLTDIPQGYTSITSGLGDATPQCLAIVPLKYNDRTEAVVELASFERLEDYQIQFIEKAGEFIASTIATVKTTASTARLLRESQEQAEILKAQEEELRQNMEEMAATQEEMERKERELAQRMQTSMH